MAVSCPPPPGAMMTSARVLLPLPSATPAPSMYQPRSLMSPVIFRSMRSKVSRGTVNSTMEVRASASAMPSR
jgi:hypothetical protein